MKREFTFLSLAAVTMFYGSLFGSTPPVSTSISATSFVENRGQIQNTCGESADDVRYLYHHPSGFNVQARKRGLSFDVWRKSSGGYDIHRLDVGFAGGNQTPAVTGLGDPTGFVNDYRHDKSLEAIPSYSRIKYDNIYEGIDLVVGLGPKGGVKYDFMLGVDANVSDIVLEYSGFDMFSIEEGELVFVMSGDTLRETIPASWMALTGQSIQVDYHILYTDDHTVQIGFETERNTVAGFAWVIDPLIELEWSTYYGGELNDVGQAIATDSLGNIFIVGNTSSIDAIASEGSYQHEYAEGESDAFLVKMNQHGLRHWSTYYGGSGLDRAMGVDVDQFEFIYMVGVTDSEDLLVADSSMVRHQDTLRGATDGFLAKFDRTGTLLWDTYLGGDEDDEITSCYGSPGQGVHVLGNTTSLDVFDPGQVTVVGEPAGGTDLFMASFSPEGELFAAGYLGGPGDETAARIRPFFDGHLIGATTSSEGLATADGFQTDFLGMTDGFVAYLDTFFVVVWASYLGGEGTDQITDVQWDAKGGAIYVCGITDADMAYTDTSSSQTEFGGETDGFVAQILAEGSLGWFTYVGGPGMDAAVSIDVDIDTTVYVLGHTYSDEGIVFYEEDSVASEYNGNGDAFLIHYDIHGTRVWSTYYGGSGAELPFDMSVYGRTGVFFTGSTTSVDSLTVAIGEEPDPHQGEYGGGGSDGFIARITGSKSTPPPVIGGGCNDWDEGTYGGPDYQPLGICLGDSIKLSAVGGFLSPGSEFVWYENSCGGTDNFIGEGFWVYVSPTELTSYFVRAEGIDEQTSCTSVAIHVDQPITVTATAQDSVCPGQTVELSAEGAMYYTWSGPLDFYAEGPDVTIDSTSAAIEGDYTVHGSSQFGCKDDATVNVSLLPTPQFTVDAGNPLCIDDQNGSIHITGNDTTINEYFWPDIGVDTMHRDSLPAGIYPLWVTNSFGCQTNLLIELEEPVWPIDSVITTADTCGQGMGSAQIFIGDSTSAFDIAWPFATDSNQVAFDGLNFGSYTVALTDSNGCVFETAFTVPNYGEFNAVIAPDSVFLAFSETMVIEVYASPAQDVVSYAWYPDEGLSCSDCAAPVFDPDSTHWYTAVITARNGCTSSDSVFVEREVPPPGHFIPTMFSPNGDGLNDELCILGNRILTARLSIFSRSGEKMFETTDLKICWDGRFKGDPVMGSVIYTFEATLEEDKTVTETGNITILR